MAKSKKVKHIWKTKMATRENGSKSIMMICQNSNLELSKYPEFSPEDGSKACDVWSEVVSDTTASLCSKCTMRSVSF